MTTIYEYFDKIKAQDRLIDEAKLEIERLKKEAIAALHPVKIGEKVIVTGYSFQGKEIAVDALRIDMKYSGYAFMAHGYVIKKDGKPGSQRGEHRIDIKKEAKK